MRNVIFNENQKIMERIYNVFDEDFGGIQITDDENSVTVEFWTDTAGQDIVVEFDYDGTPKDFVRQFEEKADAYDVDEEVDLLIGFLGERGVPNSARILVEDCEEAKETLIEIADKLNEKLRELSEIEESKYVGQVADNLIDWLLDKDYVDKDDIEEEREDIINDLMETYKVAPRLYNLIKDALDDYKEFM